MAQLRTPDQIQNDVNAKRLELLNRLESEIAEALEKEYKGEPLAIWVDGYKPQIQMVMPNLKKRFAEYNWRIILSDSLQSQKDGERVCFRLSRLDATTSI